MKPHKKECNMNILTNERICKEYNEGYEDGKAFAMKGAVKLSDVRLNEVKMRELFCEECGAGCEDCGFIDIISTLASKSSELLEVS